MKKNFLLPALLLIASFMVYCGSSQMLTAPGNAEFDVAKKHWTDVTQTDLTDGYTIFTTKCNTYHGLKNIAKRSENDWVSAIKKMSPKAKLNVEETKKLSYYILSAREILKNKK